MSKMWLGLLTAGTLLSALAPARAAPESAADAVRAAARPRPLPPRRSRQLPALQLDVNGDGYADVAVGAPDARTTFVYLGSGRGLSSTPLASAPGQEGSGAALAPAGDVNGDGFGDLLVGTGQAAVSLLFGAAGPSLVAGRNLDPGDALRVGVTVSAGGDVDGRGRPALLVGSRYGALLYGGAGSDGEKAPARVLAGPGSAALTVVGAVDFNHDGFSDLAIGSGNIGVAIYLGGPNGPRPAGTLPGSGGAAAAGDVDGDGYSDLLVADSDGTVKIYAGGRQGLEATPLGTLRDPGGDPLGDAVGLTMSSAGDVNGDGRDDVVIGAGGDRALLFVSLREAPPLVLKGVARSGFGAAVAGVGDVNGDGYDDVVIGAPGGARAHLFLGGPNGPWPTATTTLTGPPTFGSAIARVSR